MLVILQKVENQKQVPRIRQIPGDRAGSEHGEGWAAEVADDLGRREREHVGAVAMRPVSAGAEGAGAEETHVSDPFGVPQSGQ